MKARVKFVNPDNSQFFPTLRKRVNHYFQDNNISRYGNREMFTKTIVLLGIYLACYVIILSLPVSPWLLLPFVVLMGIAKSGVGMSVMHDALHGSYSQNPTVNKWMGNTIYMLGSNASVWKIQHNVLHHTYTNIHGMDEDIGTKVVIRLSDQTPLKSFHRYQHIYVFFLYGLMTLKMLTNDFSKILNYKERGMLGQQKSSFGGEYTQMVLLKITYLFFVLVLPVLITPLLWWQVLIGFMVMHLTSGFILSTIFQMAHIVEEAHQPMPNQEGNIENAWAIHQLETTANFAPKNRILNWYIGGLNYQIEHHLFPNVCHVHYRKIADIVQQTAKEFKLDYHVQPTFRQALGSHVRMLKALGTKASLSPRMKMAR
jgi:linoleoyl-CoA desaturase